MSQKLAQVKKPILKAVDFFCCSGGVTNGFKKAGIKVLGGIDVEGAYKETYEKNNKGSKFLEADIAKLQPKDLISAFGISRNMDDLVFVGCSPCQYYTNLKTDKTKSSESRLLLEDFQRFVAYFNPGFIFVENVPGLETKEESPLSYFKQFLKSKNYTLDESIVNAADYNVPQSRRRYVLIASRVTNKLKIPKPTNKTKNTVRSTIGHLPQIKAGHKDGKELMHWTAGLAPINLKRIQNTSHDGGNRLEWKDDKELQLKCYEGRDSIFSDVYGRIYWDYPAPTITTKFNSFTNGRFGHPEQDRALSLREGALLQSFPSDYKFYSDNMGIVARMIGNAVPPKLAMVIGSELVKRNRELTLL
ncbi:MAG: DNA cytosine methyltransferase [Ferruginibacter sp.]